MAKQTCTSADLGFLLEAMAKTLGPGRSKHSNSMNDTAPRFFPMTGLDLGEINSENEWIVGFDHRVLTLATGLSYTKSYQI